MLSASDISISTILPLFVDNEVDVAFLVPTATGMGKGIMDATGSVRSFFFRNGYHDYASQSLGQEHKKIGKAYFVTVSGYRETTVSIYRPRTKQGDPRLWFYRLSEYCKPYNLLAITIHDDVLYVFNMSMVGLGTAMASTSTLAGTIFRMCSTRNRCVADELLDKLREIHLNGFILGVKHGDTSVGMTLEHCLGIPPNSSKQPDYKGIELKAKRMTDKGKAANASLQTLFTQVPDWDRSPMNASEILDKFGYYDGNGVHRLYCTVTNEPNAQGLLLAVRSDGSDLVNLARTEGFSGEVAYWSLECLKSRLSEKHRETFWVAAASQFQDGNEYFRYDTVTHSRSPKVDMLDTLLEHGVVSLDYTLKGKPSGKVCDHGYLFRMRKQDLKMLFPHSQFYDLDEVYQKNDNPLPLVAENSLSL